MDRQLAYAIEIENREIEDKVIFCNSNLSSYIDELNDVRNKKKILENVEKEILYMIDKETNGKDLIVDQSTGEIIATFKSNIRDYFDVKTFKEKYPIYYNDFVRKTEYKSFIIKQKEIKNESIDI